MPNHTQNIITGTPEAISKLKEFAWECIESEGGKEGRLDFNKFIPVPKELDDIVSGMTTLPDGTTVSYWRVVEAEDGEKMDVPVDGDALVEEHGYACSYDFCCGEWGTKWNSYWGESGEEVLAFTTAWSEPLPIYEKIAEQFPDLEFTVRAYHEGGFGGCEIHICDGSLSIHEWDGPEVEQLVKDEWSEDSYELGYLVVDDKGSPLCKTGTLVSEYPDSGDIAAHNTLEELAEEYSGEFKKLLLQDRVKERLTELRKKMKSDEG